MTSRDRWSARELADRLRGRIERGELAAGERLPSVAELVKDSGLARGTVMRALGILEQEGLLSVEHGRGTFVRAPLVPILTNWSTLESRAAHSRSALAGELDQWATAVAGSGRTPRAEVTVQVVQPPADVAEWLHVQGGGLTVLRHRIRYVDEEPFQLADSYVPYDMARDNPILMAPGDQSRPGGLLADAGLVQVRAVDLLTCRMPTNTETELLNLPPATPVVRHMRTGYDEGDMPLRVMVSILPGDRHVIRYDVHLD